MPTHGSPRRSKIPTIEFLKNRLYLASFDTSPADTDTEVHFTIDDSLPYNAFHHDFGPLHIGHLYRFAVTLHEILADENNRDRSVIFYSRTNPRSRANAACVLCCYMVLIQSWPPHLALAPIAQAEPPLMPFRDAGYSVADFTLSVQDVVYGVWKAKDKGLLDMREFDLEEYETYERVEMGDFNTIPPHFVAFASPQYSSSLEISPHKFPTSVRNVIDFFIQRNVQLVVRLNSPLYDSRIFENRGIRHVDMIFEDGTCPGLDMVRKFVGAASDVISRGGMIAVHCKAGLGRTGCLIGAYLIYAYGFTAGQVISYMRFMRPGMVVGPQQHWLYQNQNEFRDWRFTMALGSPMHVLSGYRPLVPLDIIEKESSSPRTPIRNILGEVENNASLPAPTPGQPRKSPGSLKSRHASFQTNDADSYAEVDELIVAKVDENQERDILSVRKTRSTSSSPSSRRSVSYSAVTTTTTTLTTTIASQNANRAKASRRINSGQITVDKLRGASTGGIRKASGSAKSSKIRTFAA
ncbi:dual specificity protein phosphatase [Lipomyces japonicus]|uniref:dual specificity protein phosphatase n=1 Tax=Lipomyces japonicus TaxID=56871 RepID=UPI0034CED10F